MTERLYLADSRMTSHDCTVLSCTKAKGGWELTLDCSIFFPNKGGQPCDTGSIGEAKVLEVCERGEELVLLCDRELEVGKCYGSSLDAARRHDIMQQHTGEHLLSYCAWVLYGAVNVGFHCALDYATLDLDKPLTREQLEKLESYANELACRDLPVKATVYESEEALQGVELRKHAEGLSAPIRIVEIEGADRCTCCAPHVYSTGEIGQLFIEDAIAYKGGCRINFLCGGRALKHARLMHDAMDAMARSFSVSRELVEESVRRTREQLSEAKRLIAKQNAELDIYIMKELESTAQTAGKKRLITASLKDIDSKRLRGLCLEATKRAELCCLFSFCGDKLYYVLASRGIKLDMGELIQAVNPALGGKGGGKGELAQGSAALNSASAQAIEQLNTYFLQRLKAL